MGRGRQTAWSRECKWYCTFPPLLGMGKAAGAVAVTAQLAAQEGDLDYARSSVTASALAEPCPLDGPLSKGGKQGQGEELFCSEGEHQPSTCGEGR